MVLLFGVFLIPCAARAQSGVFISEFMASNGETLQDEDGDTPDWIEIANASGEEIDLAGWHLTDNANNTARWTFPNTLLPDGGYLVVFASGKDRAEPGSELHTNFRLSAGGEYLALVRPEGSVTHEFAPEFPPQFRDISYGVGREVRAQTLLAPGAAAQVWIPADDSLGPGWTEPAFDDALWLAATTGIGFDLSPAGQAEQTDGVIVLNLDLNHHSSDDDADTQPGFDAMTLSSNGSTFNGIKVTLSALGGATLDSRDRPTPVANPPDFTQDQLYDDFVFANGTFDGAGMRILIEGLLPETDYSLLIWSFDTGSSGNRLSDWIETAGAQAVAITNGYTFNGLNHPTHDYDYTLGSVLRTSSNGTLQIEGRRNGGTSHGVFVNAIRLVQIGLGGLVQTDVSEPMHGFNASAYVRLPFVVEDPAAFDLLTLRMQYADGFAAYLNGHLVAARNAPETPAWNAAALSKRPVAGAISPENMVISSALQHLVPGTNILAFHALNSAAGDAEFLLLPQLEAATVTEHSERYFTSPTPGAPNDSAGVIGFVGELEFSHPRGFHNEPFELAITSPTPGVEIRYTLDGSLPTLEQSEVYSGPIRIERTGPLRATGFKAGYGPTAAVTHTHIFPDQVIRQTGEGLPQTWQPGWSAYYRMDPRIVDAPEYQHKILEGLKWIPTLSLALDPDDFLGPTRGIYNHSHLRGRAWERDASAELIYPDGSTGFALNMGLRMHGGASRLPDRTPKHSFRLYFRSAYGESKLRHPWMEGSPVERFDRVILRACFTDSFSTRYQEPRYRPEDSQYLRDVWMRDSQLDMGHLSSRSTFVHLYVNGLYWGLYNPSERLDASFFADHLGGETSEWDVIHDFGEVRAGTKQAWNTMMSLANAGLQTESAYQEIQEWLDLDNLIDYMLLHFYGEAEDWPHHNWAAARRRPVPEAHFPGGKFIFLVWDQEIVLDVNVRRNRLDVSHNDTPARLYSRLRQNAEFRLRFADRIHRHMFNKGALAPEENIARWMRRANEIDLAVIGESARWGYVRRDPPFTHTEWLAEQERLVTILFPYLHELTLDRFQSAELYPSTAPPIFNRHGGLVGRGFQLGMRATDSIYFTLDGSDPRVPGTGAISANALAYQGTSVGLTDSVIVKARALRDGEWSALNEAFFEVDPTGTLDSDGDGIPDWWEWKHGLNPYFAGDALLDYDGDGFNNLEEYLAGTDPRNPESYLKFERVFQSEQWIQFEFQAAANRSYSILHRTRLENGDWQKLADVLPAEEPRYLEIQVPMELAPQGFFQLVAPARP